MKGGPPARMRPPPTVTSHSTPGFSTSTGSPITNSHTTVSSNTVQSSLDTSPLPPCSSVASALGPKAQTLYKNSNGEYDRLYELCSLGMVNRTDGKSAVFVS